MKVHQLYLADLCATKLSTLIYTWQKQHAQALHKRTALTIYSNMMTTMHLL